MPLLNITDMKVISPSPNNFILDLEISGKHYNYIASGEQIYQNSNGTIDNKLLEDHVAHSSIIKIVNNFLYVCNDSGLFYYNIDSQKFEKITFFDEDSIVGEIRENNGILYLMVSEKVNNDITKRKIQFYKLYNNNITKLGSLPYTFDARWGTGPAPAYPASVDSYFSFSIASNTLMYATYGTAKRLADEGYAYGTNSPGVFKSTDGGITWELLEDSPRPWEKNGSQGTIYYEYQCVCALKDTNTVFTMSLNNISKSTDGGLTWENYLPNSLNYPSAPFIKLNIRDFYTFDGITFYCIVSRSSLGGYYIYKVIKNNTDNPTLEYISDCDEKISSSSRIFMINENEFYITHNDLIGHTKNKGKSWEFIHTDDIIEREYDPNIPIYNHCETVHSLSYKNITTITPLFAIFDMNDMGITTDDEDIDNLLLMPNANTIAYERDLSSNLIPMHSINSNAVYGYVRTELSSSFGFPIYDKTKQKFLMGTHNKNAYSDPTDPKPGTTDTLTLYRYRKNATNISGVLGLGKQADISAANLGFDKLFVFDPTDDNNIRVGNTVRNWRSYQTNRPFAGGFTNNFDDSLLLARAILFPKQTLNNEYSTEREYISSEVSAPFQQTRKYNWNTDKYFYSNGTHIILNHRDDTKFAFADKDTSPRGGTMVTSTYSRRFGDEKPKEHLSPQPPNGEEEIIALDTGEKVIAELDYNKYGTFTFENSNISSVSGLYNQYSPELINRENETMSDTALMTSRHKTNIFDIEFRNGIWKGISDAFKNNANNENKTAYEEIKENLKNSIRTNLFKLVEEIKPAHTKLYKITFDSEDA